MAVDTLRMRLSASRGLGGRWLRRWRDDLFAQGDDAPLGDNFWAGLYVQGRDGAGMSIPRAASVGVGVNQLGVQHAGQVFFYNALYSGQRVCWNRGRVLEGVCR